MVGLLLGVLLLLGACTETYGPEDFNEAGVRFMQGMAVHHAQGVEMAQLVEDRAANNDLRELASRIAADQQREIATMERMLGQADAAPAHDMGHQMMPGMMSEQAMAELSSLSGPEFDLRFTEMMTAHHQGAIDMSQQVLQEGENPQVINLAQHIIQAQGSEIAQMTRWRQAWTS